MSGLQVAVPLQGIIRLMVAAQMCQNGTLPSIQQPSLAPTTKVVPSDYVRFPEYGLAYKFFDTVVSYNEAISLCLGQNGQLAVVDSTEKIRKILNTFSSLQTPLVGIHFSPDTERWETIDGKSRHVLPWALGEPNGSGKCVFLARNYDGLRNNGCEFGSTYLCEIALPGN